MKTDNTLTIANKNYLRVVRCLRINLTKEEFRQLPRSIAESWHHMTDSEKWNIVHSPKPTVFCTPLLAAYNEAGGIFE